ncbi:carboxymuconolactone decarboxylase family protein [Lentzea xinjiangensis]|uniref:carboxymuconolactone decarboxylase family protein n=1 Tax=Lentzea xinjiangensis TaxID=402600 RepID=UPI0011603CD6|nr:carboxymuconolactone decarboxylase family protein [Lentzea xinjiangensis]
MSRIETAGPSTQNPQQQEARALLRKAWGGVPNLGEVIALSTPLTRALLDFDRALGKGAFRGKVGEQLAIAVANENRCAYCLAAHSDTAREFGVSEEDILAARSGHASDPKVQAALTFVQRVVRHRGRPSDDQLAEVRAAGYGDPEIVELVGHAIATTLTNYLHHLSDVPLDFPAVEFAAEDPATV